MTCFQALAEEFPSPQLGRMSFARVELPRNHGRMQGLRSLPALLNQLLATVRSAASARTRTEENFIVVVSSGMGWKGSVRMKVVELADCSLTLKKRGG